MSWDTAPSPLFHEIRSVEVCLRGTPHFLTIRPFRYEELPGLIKDRAHREHAEAWFWGHELRLVVSLDGAEIDQDDLAALMADERALAAVLAARDQLYTWLVEQGRVHAICPVCGEGKELDLGFYALALHMRPWPIVDGMLLATPKLADPEPPEVRDVHGERPVALRGLAPRPGDVPRAARIDFELPSGRVGFADPEDPVSGTMGDIDHLREREAWRTYGQIGGLRDGLEIKWDYDEAWFRAALRLMVATIEVRDRAGNVLPLEPPTFTWMWLADVQFLDALYTATHDVPAGPDAIVTCSSGHAFLPVR